jgi:dolichol kinase
VEDYFQEDLEILEVQVQVHHLPLHLVLVQEILLRQVHHKEILVEVHQITFQILELAAVEELVVLEELEFLLVEVLVVLE